MYLNKLQLIGFIGGNAQEKTTSTDRDLVRFDLATQSSWKNKGETEYQRRTEWHKVVVWGNLTKFARSLKKGDHIYVAGQLRYREYEKEGRKVDVAELHAEEIKKLGRNAATPAKADPELDATSEAVPY